MINGNSFQSAIDKIEKVFIKRKGNQVSFIISDGVKGLIIETVIDTLHTILSKEEITVNLENGNETSSESKSITYSKGDHILYHYTSYETAKLIIGGNSLKFSDPNDFNDPFDLANDIFELDINPEDSINLVKKYKPEIGEKYSQMLNSILKIDPEHLKKTAIKNLEEMKKAVGIACFTTDHENALMWSHYAEKHKGICLGFKMRKTESIFLAAVTYSTDMIRGKYLSKKMIELNDVSQYFYWFFTKSHIWAYEKEVRALCFDMQTHCKNEYRTLPFPKGDLVEIYYGINTSDKNIEELDYLLTNNGYKLENIKRKKMEIDPKTYDFK